MTTEYGQRIWIEQDPKESGQFYRANSYPSFETDDEEDDKDDTDVEMLLGEVDHIFGITSSSKGYGSNGNYFHPTGGSNRKVSLNLPSQNIQTIRFQVVVWNIGTLDVASGTVPMTFRISLFWNDVPAGSPPGSPSKPQRRTKDMSFQMKGRQKAVPQRMDISSEDNKNNTDEAIDIPPISILNVSTFTIIGSPEIDMLDCESRLVRWTCMYRATVVQGRINVSAFPHDCHTIALEMAILSHRKAGQRWDRRFWRLGLATEDDVRVSRKALQIPYGLVVDHVRIPGEGILPLMKSYNTQESSASSSNHGAGLQFQFCSQQDKSFDRRSFCSIPDVYLRVSLMVIRESGYYDRNIVPLLAFLNVVAAAVTLILDPSHFFHRGLLILNIAFNQIGIRLSVDKNLPSVGYEIRMQSILNEFFFILLALILEAGTVYALEIDWTISSRYLKWVDALAACLALGHNAYTVRSYYVARNQARQKYCQGILEKELSARFSTRGPLVV
ncbi:expressed unknown protein [Seminavis robusta]|uniref:Uncharacterized protein n=1 Tax=Seminavis robusta TaxID=568900 RepID=A0A9N8HYV1_9STRA|nr:expressed unknown protein [Seminavis robusta]|eukprot:Sro2094_g314180.1 n/a (500) ;mRNA; r:13831-15392